MADSQEVSRTDVNTLGEFGLIEHLTQRFALTNDSSKLGIGDDAAILDYGGKQTVISTDMLVEGIHFDLSYSPLKHLGYKAVVVNLSDIYAMNAQPKQVLVSMALSSRFSVEALEELYAGIKMACAFYHVDLIGGDTTSSNKGLVLSVTAIGEVEEGRAVTRRTAKARRPDLRVGQSGCCLPRPATAGARKAHLPGAPRYAARPGAAIRLSAGTPAQTRGPARYHRRLQGQ